MDPLSDLQPTAGRAGAVLLEVATALEGLSRDQQMQYTIDLHSLPMDDDERAWLRARLGSGEVRAALDVAGHSTVDETGFAGVWWVRHGDAEGRAGLEQIVVARVPALLLAHPDDVADAAGRLAAAVDEMVENLDG
jgi:hydrogenase-1 operon protein HyaF